MNSVAKTVVFWLVIVVSAFLLWQTVKSGTATRAVPEISFSDFMTRVETGQVRSAKIEGSVINAVDAKGDAFRVIAPPNQAAMLDALRQHGVAIWFKDKSEPSWPNWLLNLAPLILLAALWFFMIRKMQRRSGTPPSTSGIDSSETLRPHFGP